MKEIILHITPEDAELLRTVRGFVPYPSYAPTDSVHADEVGKFCIDGVMFRVYEDIKAKMTYSIDSCACNEDGYW